MDSLFVPQIQRRRKILYLARMGTISSVGYIKMHGECRFRHYEVLVITHGRNIIAGLLIGFPMKMGIDPLGLNKGGREAGTHERGQ